MDVSQFKQSHGAQLQRIPPLYWTALHEKLSCEEYDAGKYFTMSPTDDDEGWKVFVANQDGVSKDDPSCVFLIDHAWTFQPPSARQQLSLIPGLANRMAALMNIIKLPTVEADDDENNSYDADSESGDETRDWESIEESRQTINQSNPSFESLPLPEAVPEVGYSSGDLGDVSHAYTTEHAQEDKSDQSDTGSDTPRKSFEDRYRIPKVEEKFEKLTISESVDVGGQVGLSNQISDLPSKDVIDAIVKKMWSYCHAYHINNSPVPVWYIMDEFGSRIQQSHDPSVAMAVFFYIPTQMAFTVMWPVRDLEYGDEATCNFIPECVKPGLDHWCHALPWSHDSHMSLDNPLWKELNTFTCPEPTERCNEDYPSLLTPSPPPKPTYTVHTDIKVVQSHLTVPEFKAGCAKEDADILWLAEHFKDFRTLKPNQYVNQFPCENILTCKDLLATVAKRATPDGTQGPVWLPTTFNLAYELPRLVKCFRDREERNKENIWIVKPWNLGRGLDIHITDDLVHMIRLAQSGPKIASKYITDPVLFLRDDIGLVKFDVRYIVLLKSVSPLELYVYDVFWLRFANKPFSLDDLYDYDKHFTVMNYKEDSNLKQVGGIYYNSTTKRDTTTPSVDTSGQNSPKHYL